MHHAGQHPEHGVFVCAIDSAVDGTLGGDVRDAVGDVGVVV